MTILSGFDYKDKEPFIILDFFDSTITKRTSFYLRNKAFTLQKLEDTYCIGAYSLQNMQFNPCPNKARVEDGKTMCPLCKKTSGFNPAFYNTDIHSPQQQVYNARPHVVYLANFGIGQTKVGIAHRTPRRWLEQGARTATIIKHCNDAYEARELEAEIVSSLNLLEALSSNVKRKLLTRPYRVQKGIEELNTIRDQIESTLSYKLEINPVIVLDEFYLPQNFDSINNLIDITKTSSFISGEFVALIGDTLIMRNGTNNYMTSLKQYISHKITLDGQVKENDLIISGQPSLF